MRERISRGFASLILGGGSVALISAKGPALPWWEDIGLSLLLAIVLFIALGAERTVNSRV